MNNKNEKVVVEMNENVAAEQDTIEVVEIQKKGLIARFKALKTWQKVLVIFLLTGTVAVSVTVIYKLINKKPEAVAQAIDAVSATAPEVAATIIENAVA